MHAEAHLDEEEEEKKTEEFTQNKTVHDPKHLNLNTPKAPANGGIFSKEFRSNHKPNI